MTQGLRVPSKVLAMTQGMVYRGHSMFHSLPIAPIASKMIPRSSCDPRLFEGEVRGQGFSSNPPPFYSRTIETVETLEAIKTMKTIESTETFKVTMESMKTASLKTKPVARCQCLKSSLSSSLRSWRAT